MEATQIGIELFWNEVAKKSSHFDPEAIVVINGKKMGNASESQRKMYSSCTMTDIFAAQHFANPPKRVVDIGCGLGVNSIPMALGGAHVTAIDSSEESLKTFQRFCKKASCPSANVRLVKGNLVTISSYFGPYDLALVIDTLPYIPPANLRSTIDKIHACLADGGLLIGTIFTEGTDPNVIEFMEKLGAHFYPNETTFVTNLLQYSGFKVLKLEEREHGGFRFKARKISA